MEDRTLLTAILVTNLDDSGPGSLRQAILDANAGIGNEVIDFAIPGSGVQTIEPISPLPAISRSVFIDGSTQPGFAGSPLIALAGQWAGVTGGLEVRGSSLSVLGLSIDRYTFGTDNFPDSLTIESAPSVVGTSVNPARSDRYQIDLTSTGRLLAQVQAHGLTTRLSLLDSSGNVLVESDGQGPQNPDDLIDQHLPAGTYFLVIQVTSGAGEDEMKATFTPTSSTFQGTNPVIGDFNGDGIPDLVGLDGVHPGLGDGTFGTPVAGLGLPARYDYQAGLRTMYAGDFNGDGKLDLLVNDFYDSTQPDENDVSDTLLLLLGNGDGTFQKTTYVVAEPAGGLGDVVTGDFNGDGRLDIAFAEGSSNVYILLSHGDGTFQAPEVFQVGNADDWVVDLVAGDFHGDGRLDLAYSLSNGGIGVLLGNGNGTFRPPVVTKTSTGIGSLVAGDFNGDGKVDLAAYSSNSGDLLIFFSRGDGSFLGPAVDPLKFPPTLVQVGDFNGDGKVNLLAWDFQFTNIDDGAGTEFVSFLAGNGDGTFQSPRITAQTAGSQQIANPLIGDVDRDGKLDLIEPFVDAYSNLNSSTSFSVLLGNGNGTFRAAGAPPTDTIPSAVALGDFNSDGRIDLAVASVRLESLTILLGDGEGGYRVGQQIPLGPLSFMGTPVVGDFNADGRLDLAVIIAGPGPSDGTRLVVLLGNGDGTFQDQAYPIPDGAGILVTVGGFRFSTGLDGSTPVYLGHGNGTSNSGQPSLSLPGVSFGFVGSPVLEDFNGDGRLDAEAIGVVNIDGSDNIYIFINNGKGGFSLSQTIADPYGGDPLVGDFTGDGKLDLAVLNEGNDSASISFYLGRGDGTFDPARTESVPPSMVAPYGSLAGMEMVAGAFDGGGKLELLAWDAVSQQIFMLGLNGDGTFEAPEFVPTPASFGYLYIGDLNGDGRPDLILPDDSGGSLTILLDNGDGTFSEASQVVTSPQETPLLVNVNGSGTSDLLLVNGSGDILYRQGRPLQPGSFDPPVTINSGSPSRSIVWVPDTVEGPLLASVDARDDSVTLYAYRNGRFVRMGSLTTGLLPAQIIAADLNHDGWDDLVVRNAGDGTLVGLPEQRSGFHDVRPKRAVPPGGDNPGRPRRRRTQGDRHDGRWIPGPGGHQRLDRPGERPVQPGQRPVRAPAPYRAGVSASGFDDSSGSVRITSLESTSDVAGGSLTPGGPISLIVADPGTETLDLLQGLGGGRFANPVVLEGSISASVIRTADFNHDGIMDLAVLDDQGVSIFLGLDKGGFLPPVTDDAGPDPTGLTIADVNSDGDPDLIVGNPYGDVLVLLNRGDGTFAPYHNADQSITLAVADLTGDGSKDVIYADQGLDRVVVDYGAGNSTVLGDRSSGLLSPGAVRLADLNGDGIPDLIVANSGSNNVLVFPGLGNGQFGPAVNGGHGFFTGTNPIGLTVADLNGDGIPDLIVANSGSNDVSILLGQGKGSSWTLTPGPRIKTDAGPVAVAVGPILGTSQIDLAVANQQADNVQVFPGVGGGFFNDTAPVTYPVGQAPSGLFLGNFTGSGQEIATLNAGSSTISLIGPAGVIQTIGAGGLRPVSGFAGDFNGNGFTDLVVGDNGDGQLALFTGGPGALTLSQTITSAEVPSPTSLSFAGVSDGVLSFYASTEGRETATLLAFNLEGAGSSGGSVTGEGLAGASEQSAAPVLASATAGVFQQVAQLLGRSGSPLDLVAPLFTVSVIPGEFGVESFGEGGVALLASFTPGASANAPGQSLGSHDEEPGGQADEEAQTPVESDATKARGEPSRLPLWGRMAMGLETAWEELRSELLEKEGVNPGAANRADRAEGRATPPAPAHERSSDGSVSGRGLFPFEVGSRPEAIGMAIDELVAEQDAGGRAHRESSDGLDEVFAICRDRPRGPIMVAVAVASTLMIGRYVKLSRFGRSRLRAPGPAQESSGR